MKYIGMLLLLAAGLGLGQIYAGRLYRRERLLRQVSRLMAVLCQRMTHTALPLATLWKQLATEKTYAALPLVQETAKALDNHTFSEAFALGAKATDGLQDADCRLLTEFGEGCGRTGLEAQVAHIRTYRQLLDEMGAEAEKTAATKGPVIQMMGLAGGAALALLLM